MKGETMKKYLILSLVLALAFGCSQKTEKKDILAKVNNYEITKDEFEEEFINSNFGRTDTLESRKEFLNTLINRKLILQDAQRKVLDRENNFLKMIERFWEQSLIKLVLDTKAKEISSTVLVNDRDIKAVYEKMAKDGVTNKSYAQMYQQIKWELTKVKESKRMNDWMATLRNQADIKINEDLLKEGAK
jgi:hypothetical protein